MHITAVQQHPLLGADIDFKLAPSPGPRSPEAAAETGFTSLAVTLCKVCLIACLKHALPTSCTP